MKNNILHIVIVLVLVVLLILLSDPFMLWMPPLAVTLALLGVATVMCVLAGFVIKERSGDEREMIHRMNAGRIAYLSGLAVLTIAFVMQGFSHAIDPWIPIALVVMVVSKLIARIYFERYQ
ncbi:MAG: hypothetical protein AAB407_02580 [Patescibacteria group bacterium]